ncbi:MAG TPA: alpha-glucosidase [Firmicutes bacterium]|nr:alpha-glucosidase [Bacillota bacterium]
MNRTWWKEAVVYQVYPRSFYDTDGDGIGDLRGIIEKLDYIKELGVDVIWLNPVYQSPNDDNGYDISDYYAIMTEFGTMADFEELLAEAHRRDLRIIMDLVVNHTSDEHPWFIESRSSKDNPKRDFYIWRPPRNGREPNNWRSFFSPFAWEWDEATGEYYLHLFSKKQPDLNWKNPLVRQEIYKMMRWWLDKGIDGFRMDVINMLAKAPGLPDAPVKPGQEGDYVFAGALYANQPGIHEILQEMHREVLSNYDIMTVGETCFTTPEMAALYVNADRKELNMIFQFEFLEVGTFYPWDLVKFKEIWGRWIKMLSRDGWNSIYLGNHDQPRQVSRFGNDGPYWAPAAKLLATFTHTLPGTPFIYQGEEIGMTNVAFPSIEDYRDIETINRYDELVKQGLSPAEALAKLQPRSRDNARTPMQWSAEPNAGFTSGTPWIKVNPNYTAINVADQLHDEDSVLNYYKKLLRLRRANPVFVYGDYSPVAESDPNIFAYYRSLDDQRVLVILNFSSSYQRFELPGAREKVLLLGNYGDTGPAVGYGDQVDLRPWEARIYQCL